MGYNLSPHPGLNGHKKYKLKQELEAAPGALSRRQSAARERAARERQARVEEALRQWPLAAASKKPKQREEARVSTSDPEARVMKMGNGGFRPAHNLPFTSDTKSQVVVGVGVSNIVSERGQRKPMVEQVQERG